MKEIRVKDQNKYDYAFLLFMQGVKQKDICERVKTTHVTLQKWKEQGEWETKKLANSVSTKTIAQKLLKRIDEEADQEELKADAISKLVSQLSKLDVGITINDIAEVFLGFGSWLEGQNDVSVEFVRKVTELQDRYITKQRNNG